MAELLQRPYGSTELGGYLYDRNGNRLGLVDQFEPDGDLASFGSPSNDWTYADVKAQNARNAKEMGFQAGAGALASLAQIGIGAIPTSASARNEERLAELQQAEAAGKLGLTPDERAQLEATLLTPARQLARQAEEETGKRLAAMPTASLATQQAIQQANQKAAQQAAVKAGIEMGRANIEAKREQTAELESRLKDKAKQEARNIDTAIGAIGDIAKMGGRIAAAQTQVRDLSDKDIAYMTTAKTAEGKPLYEWAYGKDAATVRDAANRQKAYDVMSAQKAARDADRKAKRQNEATGIGALGGVAAGVGTGAAVGGAIGGPAAIPGATIGGTLGAVLGGVTGGASDATQQNAEIKASKAKRQKKIEVPEPDLEMLDYADTAAF